MSLTINDVRRISDLARIDLSDANAEKLMVELNDILSMVEQIQSIDTTGRTRSGALRDFVKTKSRNITAEKKICRMLRTSWTAYSWFQR